MCLNAIVSMKSFIGSETSLMHAIRWRDATMVDLLLRFRADSEEIDATGKTALHKACILRESSLKSASSALEMVQILLKYGADLTAIDKVKTLVCMGRFL
jgi:ankyrin repeat protein